MAVDTAGHDTEGYQGAADHVEVLREAAQGYVHVLIGLGEHIHRYLVVAVVLIEVNGFRREGFVIAVVVLDTGLINDNLGVLDHVVANIRFCVQLKSSGNGDIAVNGDPAFQVLAFENGQGDEILILTAEADNSVFMQCPLRVCSHKRGCDIMKNGVTKRAI